MKTWSRRCCARLPRRVGLGLAVALALSCTGCRIAESAGDWSSETFGLGGWGNEDRSAEPPADEPTLQASFFAKALCSALWVNGREQTDFLANDLAWAAGDLLDQIEFDVANERRAVTARVPGSFAHTAVFHEGHGCTALPRGATDVFFEPQPLSPPSLSDDEPWPLGRASGAAQGTLDAGRLEKALERGFQEVDSESPIRTRALVVIHRGRLVAERYAQGFDASSPMIGWSMGKSLTAGLIGLLIQRGDLALDQPAPVPLWQGDPRAEITIRHLLNMSSGLDFARFEGLPPSFASANHHMAVYFGEPDVFWYSFDRPAEHPPGELGRYRNCDPLTLGWIVRDVVERQGLDYQRFPYEALFHRLGMTSLVLERDLRGNLISSGYDHATARDFARFGLLLLRDGDWFGERLLPEGFADFVSTPAPGWEDGAYGGLFWLNRAGYLPNAPRDTYFAQGALGQFTLILPSHDLVVVRMGYSTHTEEVRRSVSETLAILAGAVEDATRLESMADAAEAAG